MKRTIAVLIAIAMAATFPLASAQDESAYVLLGDDVEGDVDGAAENPWDAMDLKSLEIQEDVEGFHFRLGVSNLDIALPPAPPTGEPLVDEVGNSLVRGVDYNVHFEVHSKPFQVRINYVDEPAYLRAWLGTENPEFGFIEFLTDIPVSLDESTPGFRFSLSHQDLLDAQGTQPRPGDYLQEFRVTSDSTVPFFVGGYSQNEVITQEDRLPDSGTLTNTWAVQQGVVSTGHLLAWSDIPVRVSNGEATTFLYEVDVQNNADFGDTVVPDWEGGAEQWAVTFPTGKLRLEPGETRTVPFLVTVPFAHEHGRYFPFTVSFQSQADPLSTGLVELGVRYTAIPQPAGHHPSLFLHGTVDRGYFNTVEGENYPEDAEPVPEPRFSGSCSSNGVWRTQYPLSPGLEMGIDFDMEAVGEANWIVSSELPSSGYSVSGYFVVSDEEPWGCGAQEPEGTVAVVEQSEPIDLSSGETTIVTANIMPRPLGDYMPLERGTNLWFVYILHEPDLAVPTLFSVNGIGDETNSEPRWQPDTSFRLPLKEFHDDVDDYFADLSGIDLFPVNSQQRYVNPGETTVFRVEATNVGITETTFNLETTGANTEWASLLGTLTITLEPGESRVLAMAVRAPESGTDGELADVTLHAASADDDSVRSLIRLLAEVDTDADHEDEIDQVLALDAELQEAPAPFAGIFGVLVGLAVALRRHQA